MTKTETFCDICGEKMERTGKRILFRDGWAEEGELDICNSCMEKLIEYIQNRQLERSTTS